MELVSNNSLSKIARTKGINNWNELQSFLRNLPYGRTSNNSNLELVFNEGKGTCSSKHAVLKQISIENNIALVQLILCIYKMSESNTPGIGDIINSSGLDYIPEAHCYIKHDNIKIDITNPSSDLSSIESAVLQEKEIQVDQIVSFKQEYHRAFLNSWIDKNKINYSLDQLWAIRETCIYSLSQ